MGGMLKCFRATLIVLAILQSATAFASGPGFKTLGLTKFFYHPSGHNESSSVAVTVMVTGGPDPSVLPISFVLFQNFPNPFNSVTTIKYDIPEAVWARMEVYDVLGKKVATLVNEYQNPGNYSYQWKDADLSTGVFFYRLTAGRFQQTKRMLLIK